MNNSIIKSTDTKKTLDNFQAQITVSEKDGIQTVSARELHEKLESSERFSKWWERFASYGFEENTDFTSVPFSTVVNNGASREIGDYQITIEMAKQICMLQRSDKGREYREYFIKLEKAWNTPEMVMARALQVANKTVNDVKERLAQAEKQLVEQKPKIDAYNNLIDRSKLTNFRDMAQKLGMKQTEFMVLLKSKYIYKNSIGEYRAYADYQKMFAIRTYSKGVDKTGDQLLLTLTGVCYFLARYAKDKAITVTADKWIDKNLPELAHGNI